MPKPDSNRNREDWLMAVAAGMRPWFAELGHKLPPVRMAIGFPSAGVRGKAIGECWYDHASADGTHEIFVTPLIDDPVRVAGILAHELVHTITGPAVGHKAPFKKIALAIGLEGKMTATTESDEFKRRVAPILKAAGKLPHGALSPDATNGKKKQTTRYLKCECPQCGYTVRTVRKWLETYGAPICPKDQISMEHEPLDDTEDGDGEE